jgi:hypothetical protein
MNLDDIIIKINERMKEKHRAAHAKEVIPISVTFRDNKPENTDACTSGDDGVPLREPQ